MRGTVYGELGELHRQCCDRRLSSIRCRFANGFHRCHHRRGLWLVSLLVEYRFRHDNRCIIAEAFNSFLHYTAVRLRITRHLSWLSLYLLRMVVILLTYGWFCLVALVSLLSKRWNGSIRRVQQLFFYPRNEVRKLQEI